MQKKIIRNFKLAVVLVALALVFLLVLYIGIRAMRRISQEQSVEHRLETVATKLEQNIFKGSEKVLNAVSGATIIHKCLVTGKKSDDAIIVLETANQILGSDLVYILDSTGTTIASTYYANPDGTAGSLIGQNYGFREYFKKAMQGEIDIYPGVGVTTNKRGVYCSKPIYLPNKNKPSGVAVIKIDLTIVDSLLQLADEVLLLTTEGVVFASNNPERLYQYCSNVDTLKSAQISESQQFYTRELSPLPYDLTMRKNIYNGKRYYIKKLTMPRTGWTMTVLYEPDADFPMGDEMKKLGLQLAAVFVVLFVIIMLLLNYIRLRRKSQKLLLKSKSELERTNQSLEEARSKLENQFLELTEAKEKADESIKFITAFLQNISHEIRTPLNGIIGFTEIINNDSLTPEEREHYSTIVINSSRQLTQIIHDIIEIAQLESGMVKAQIHELNPSLLIDDLAGAFSHLVYDTQLSFVVSKHSGFEQRTIPSDYHVVYKILYRLLTNAFKYTTKGKVEVGFRYSGNLIVFFVEDTGIGMSPDLIKAMFTPFRQGQMTNAHKSGGMGLGLSIAQKYCELLDGRIDIDSEPCRGTKCYITLPVGE